MPFQPSPPAAPRGKSGLFVRAAKLLYGPAYTKPVAMLLGRERRTIRRWVTGESPIPDDVWNTLWHALAQHIGKAQKTLDEVHEQTS